MINSFDITIAEKCGVNAAIVYQLIFEKIENSGENHIQLSVHNIHEEITYLTEKQIRYAITILIKNELINKENVSTNSMSRTKSYSLHLTKGTNAFDKRDKCILQKVQMHLTKGTNAFDKRDKWEKTQETSGFCGIIGSENDSQIPKNEEKNQEDERIYIYNNIYNNKDNNNIYNNINTNRDNNIKNNINNNIYTSKNKKNQVEQVIEMYHDICKSYPQVKVVSEKRRKGISACLKNPQIGMDGLKEAFTKAERNRFLKGQIKTGNQKHRNFKANFDWLTNENNVSKILNGNYDDSEETEVSQNEYFSGFNFPNEF